MPRTFPPRRAPSARLLAALAIAALSVVRLPTASAYAPCVSAGGISCTPANVAWGFDDRVRAILRIDGVVYLGGRFTHALLMNPDGSVAQSVERDHLAALDAWTGALLPWDPHVIASSPSENGDVYALDAYTRPGWSKPYLFAAGDFVSVATTRDGATYAESPREHVASFYPGGYGALRPLLLDTDYRTRTLSVFGRRLYLGGSFTWVRTSTQPQTPRGHLAAIDLARGSFGTLIHTWKPSTQGSVYDIDNLPNGNLVVGGDFASIVGGGGDGGGFAGEVTPSGTVVPWVTPPRGRVLDVSVAAGDACGLAPGHGCVLTGQSKSVAAPNPNNRAVLYRGDGTRLWQRGTDGDVQAVGWAGGDAIIGGHFGLVKNDDGSTDAAKKAAGLDPLNGGAYDPTWRPAIGPAATHGVWGIAGYGHVLFLGGDFTTVKGLPATRLAQFPVGASPGTP